MHYFLLGILSGFCNFLFINFVTRIIGLLTAGKYTVISGEYILLFVGITLAFVWVKRALSLWTMKVSQRISWSLRKQILTLVLRSGYRQFAGRKHRIDAAIVNDVGTLTAASMSVIDLSISVVIVVSCFTYMASISLLLFGITLCIALLGVSVYLATGKRNRQYFTEARDLENRFQREFNAILNGFREIYMEPVKGRYILDRKIRKVANESYRLNVATMTSILNSSMFGQILFYLLIASTLLVLSISLRISPGDTLSFVFTLTYVFGSIEAVMILIPSLMRAGVSAGNLAGLKKELEEVCAEGAEAGPAAPMSVTEELWISEVCFSYGPEKGSFGIGPVNFLVRKGEIVFIYGGNGSGKTTFINVLLGLYPPSSGGIKVDGKRVGEGDLKGYRALFGVVFSDFYLFDEFMNDTEPDRERWEYYLRLFELEGKVVLDGRLLSTTDLSMGQRKRLALIACLMENKPVLVIDEWAADQDPYFRKKFYEEILPLLREEGRTIIAITHDDRYYHCADRLFKMDEGMLAEEAVERALLTKIL